MSAFYSKSYDVLYISVLTEFPFNKYKTRNKQSIHTPLLQHFLQLMCRDRLFNGYTYLGLLCL